MRVVKKEGYYTESGFFVVAVKGSGGMNPGEMAAVILAGGRSSRMGENKLLLPLGGSTVIGCLIHTLQDLFAEIIVVTDHPNAYLSMPVQVAGDVFPSPVRNSLTGIHAGLRVSSFNYNFVIAGDMPFVQPDLVRYLCELCEGYDVTIPREVQHLQPLCAVYTKNCLPHMEELLECGWYKIIDFFPGVRVRQIDTNALKVYDPELLSFFNVNNPEDYLHAVKIAEERTEEAEKI
ncbi:MAG: molybdenum cofactor guanylyltransferase [Clostridiales bacterium]|nr:molybdenum cofactor guanylyltransferase [Clostridiales bacterium]